MAKYLLSAPDEDMARWKAQAKKRGMSFAAHIRSLLDADDAEEKAGQVTYQEVLAPGVAPRPADFHTKRTFAPDPK